MAAMLIEFHETPVRFVAAGSRLDRIERRGEQRPAVLTPVRSRLGDWTMWALFRLGDAAALFIVAAVFISRGSNRRPAR